MDTLQKMKWWRLSPKWDLLGNNHLLQCLFSQHGQVICFLPSSPSPSTKPIKEVVWVIPNQRIPKHTPKESIQVLHKHISHNFGHPPCIRVVSTDHPPPPLNCWYNTWTYITTWKQVYTHLTNIVGNFFYSWFPEIHVKCTGIVRRRQQSVWRRWTLTRMEGWAMLSLWWDGGLADTDSSGL